MTTTTTKQLVLDALVENNEGPDDVVFCAFEKLPSEDDWRTRTGIIIQCQFDELPTIEFDSGYGGVNGEPILVYTKHNVYFKCTYDGAEWVASVPRTIKAAIALKNLPQHGGG